MKQLFSAEQVSKYHPDKYADQISDAVLDYCLEQDPNSRVACEVMVKDNTVIFGGELKTKAVINNNTLYDIVKKVADKLNYTVYETINLLGQQSSQINGAVDYGLNTAAGDQGIMFGYACNETTSYLPLAFHTANEIIARIENKARNGNVLKGDAKCQVTVNQCNDIEKVLISVCHNEMATLKDVERYIIDLFPEYNPNLFLINPAGVWTIGGAMADCGLTGRKIVCDQYGGFAPVGGGAFSGKDPSKVDRSATYMARQIAVDLIKQFNLEWCKVQIAYAIGKKEPMSIYCTSNRKGYDLIPYIKQNYDLTPWGIIKALDLLNVHYEQLAEGCHFRGLQLPKRRSK